MAAARFAGPGARAGQGQGGAGRVGNLPAINARGGPAGGRGIGQVAAGGIRQAAPVVRGGQAVGRGNFGFAGRAPANNGARQAGGVRMMPGGAPVRMVGQPGGWQGRPGAAQMPARPANMVRFQGGGRPGGRR
jgi:hypothetical protein